MATNANNGAALPPVRLMLPAPIERVPVLEEWPGPWERWARNYSRNHLWRIAHVIGNDLEDVVSECALVFIECRLRYGTKIKSPAHFMSLYKLSVSSWFNTLALEDKQVREANEHQLLYEEPSQEFDAEFDLKLGSAKEEIREIVNIFANSPLEIMDALRKETTGVRYKDFFGTVLKHLGINKQRQETIEQELKEFLLK